MPKLRGPTAELRIDFDQVVPHLPPLGSRINKIWELEIARRNGT